MNRDSNYTLSWKRGVTHISDETGKRPLVVKTRYRSLCYLIGCLGWAPSFLFDNILPFPWRTLLSMACYCAFYFAVLYGFHLFLCAMNRKGKLSKYIEEDR